MYIFNLQQENDFIIFEPITKFYNNRIILYTMEITDIITMIVSMPLWSRFNSNFFFFLEYFQIAAQHHSCVFIALKTLIQTESGLMMLMNIKHAHF